MGRNAKEYIRINLKCEKWIAEDLKEYVEIFNKKYNSKNTLTKFIEVAILEYLENHKEEIEE